MMASAPRPAIELLAGDSVSAREPGHAWAIRASGHPPALARARERWVAHARAWVVAYPTAKLAHVSLLDAYLRAGDYDPALAEIDRFRGVAGDLLSRGAVRARLGAFRRRAGRPGGRRARACAGHGNSGTVRPGEARPTAVRSIASAANVYAYRGRPRGRATSDLPGRRGERPPRLDAGFDQALPAELAERRMLGDLYAAFGGPVPSLRQIWTTAAEAGRRAGESPKRVIAASGASAAVGLLTAGLGGDTLAVAELKPLLDADMPPEVEALLALARRDSAAARRLVAHAGERLRPREGQPACYSRSFPVRSPRRSTTR